MELNFEQIKLLEIERRIDNLEDQRAKIVAIINEFNETKADLIENHHKCYYESLLNYIDSLIDRESQAKKSRN